MSQPSQWEQDSDAMAEGFASHAEKQHYIRELRAAKAEHAAEPDEDEECDHAEHEHGVCLECGKDIMDDLVGRAEDLADYRDER